MNKTFANRLRRRTPRPGETFRFFMTLSVMCVIATMLLLSVRLNMSWIFGYLVGVNLATLLMYRYDKSAAIRSWRRVPEKALHLLEAAGGSPAALLAQRAFRHKTIKASYRSRFWLILGAQIILIVLWLVCWGRWWA